MLNTCNIKTVASLPEINLSLYKMVGSDKIADHTAEKWFHKVPTDSWVNEHRTWWFAKLGDPAIEVPVKYLHYHSEAGTVFEGPTNTDTWSVESFTNDVDGSVFALPELCLRLNEM